MKSADIGNLKSSSLNLFEFIFEFIRKNANVQIAGYASQWTRKQFRKWINITSMYTWVGWSIDKVKLLELYNIWTLIPWIGQNSPIIGWGKIYFFAYASFFCCPQVAKLGKHILIMTSVLRMALLVMHKYGKRQLNYQTENILKMDILWWSATVKFRKHILIMIMKMALRTKLLVTHKSGKKRELCYQTKNCRISKN